ncbi:LEA14-like dessication related protein [Pseudomonas delhiensis]|uniref:LEA14-like dessication related protein n=1 Tax=Pseudomonas delhiensis TaxID=366289 RepID=A0A239N9Q7_9PSED|nr:LEA type 2 family protein [Pseudomonas delhiensis]SDL15572.1 LEA14-like dessication related protein [Pseudomonas delhiensis]SNT50948.1 LEA14-like dessication related protein [Pseudomonas delhiensis]
MNYQAQTIRIISLVWIFALLSGCSWMTGNFENPDVKLMKVDVVKARLLEQQFTLHFRIDNPNDFSLPVRGLAYKVKLNDVDLAEGESSVWFTVPANGRQFFEVPVQTNLWRHMKYIVKLLEDPDKPIRYSLEGDVKTGLLFGRTVHIARNGEIIPGDFIPE